VQGGIGFVVGGICLALAFIGVPLDEFWGAVAGLHPGWLVAMVGVFMAQESLRAWRQIVMLRPLSPQLGVGDSLTIIFISYFCIHLFPARLGEVVRPLMVWRIAGVRPGAAVGVIVAERAVDLVAALAMLLIMLLGARTALSLEFAGVTVDLAVLGQRFGLLVVLPALLGLVAVVLLGHRMTALAARAVARLPPGLAGLGQRGLHLLEGFVEGFDGLRGGGRLLAVAGITFGIWSTVVLTFQLLAYGFGIDHLIGTIESVGVAVVTLLASLLPAPPGMAGVQEASGRAALALYGVSGPGLDATALAYAVVVHWWQVIIQAIGAAWFFRRAGLTVREVVRQARAEAPAEHRPGSG
jgi:uncharacterized protein (TIRG00374 family)